MVYLENKTKQTNLDNGPLTIKKVNDYRTKKKKMRELVDIQSFCSFARDDISPRVRRRNPTE